MIWNIGVIGRKLLIISLASTIIPIIIVGFIAVWYQSSDIKKQTLTTLEIIADNTVREIEQYINNLKERTLDFSSDGFIRDAVEKINRNDPSSNQIVQDLNNHIIRNKKPIIADAIETCVLNREGIVIASSDIGQIGSDYSQTVYFRMGLNGAHAGDVAQSPQSQQPAMIISAPLTSMIDDSTLGIIVNRISIKKLNRIATARPGYLKDIESHFKRIGDTGETYVVNGSKLMVTKSRFLDDVILKQVVDTEPVRLALEQGNVMLGEYLDYRGVPIMGASRILNEMNWVILAEIDKDEALAPIRGFIVRAAIFGGSVGAIFFVLIFILSGRIGKSIASIAKVTGRITQGNWNERVDVKGKKDEIAQLSNAFNKMLDALHDSHFELETRVEQRTNELAASNTKLKEEISERIQAEERAHASESRFAGILDVAEDAIISVDEEQRIIIFNKGAERIFGYSGKEMIGSLLDLLIPEKYRDMHKDYIKEFGNSDMASRRMGKRSYEISGLRKDGRIFPAEASISKLEAGGRMIFTAVLRDITERKQAEEKLKATLRELKVSNADLEQFASVASHDLQEPLRMVTSYVQLLERRYKDKLGSEANDFIYYAVDGAARMKKLINDLLSYSRVGSKGKEFRPVDCSHIIDHVKRGLELSIKESNAIITAEPLPSVMCNHVLIEQLFQNLIDNAIKFRSRKIPRIHISAKQDGNEWIFSIKDNGIGIDPRFKNKLFKMFQYINPRKDYPGSGIGLAICKKIVELHSGRIWLECRPNEGATFYFTIPVKGD